MKYDFKNIAFMIHVRVDIPERLRNLELVMDYYYNQCDNVQFIIINDCNQPDDQLRPLASKYGDTSIFSFLKNDGIYRRTLSFNRGFKQTNRPIVIAGDTDVIIHPSHIQEAENKITSGEYDHMYPYNGLFCWAKEPLVEKFKENFDIKKFEAHKPAKKDRIPYFENDNILVAHPNSRGGCIMYSSELYKKINGYNPNFIGWGYEDDEINHRISLLGKQTGRVENDNAIAWHLPHPDTVRDKHPFYDNNNRLTTYVHSLNKDQVKEYIKTWKL